MSDYNVNVKISPGSMHPYLKVDGRTGSRSLVRHGTLVSSLLEADITRNYC